MRLLLDQNLSHKLVPRIAGEFPGSMRVRDAGLSSAGDSDVWVYARTNGFTIVSKDGDFHQMSFVRGHPPKVVWIRAGNRTTREIERIILGRARILRSFLRDEEAAILVLVPE